MMLPNRHRFLWFVLVSVLLCLRIGLGMCCSPAEEDLNDFIDYRLGPTKNSKRMIRFLSVIIYYLLEQGTRYRVDPKVIVFPPYPPKKTTDFGP
jgi:hypothetical protein